MSQRTVLKAKGLYTDPNQLSGLPDGAMVKAENVTIDRMDVVESRRGFAQYGNTFGLPDQRAKQLLVYKNRILIHNDDNLYFNANPHNNTQDGNFQQFAGSYLETSPGLRIKGVESNKNFYFTTSDGIKKISAKTAADFSTAPGYIRDAGAAKALDVTGSLNNSASGFLPPNSEVAYRVVWSYRDANDNLVAGAPSSRLVISNYSNTNANVDLQFAIPESVTPDYFYQVYRSAVFTATGSLGLEDIDPGDELQLVIEDFPTALELTAGLVGVTDRAPEDFRSGGLPLYTNPSSGDGIQSSNEPPPKAKDITMYQSTLFYANTEARAKTTITLLSVEDLISGSSSITIDDTVNPAQTYTFVGSKEKSKFDFTAYAGTIPTDLNGKYALLNSAGDKRKYYLWYDNTLSRQVINFALYIGSVPSDLNSKFFILYTPAPDRTYYVWFDSTGSSVDPGSIDANGLTGYNGIRVNISSGVTTNAQVAAAVAAAINLNDIEDDFDVTYVAASTLVTVASKSFSFDGLPQTQTLEKGFSLTNNSDTSLDPSLDLITNPDVDGRAPLRVNIARGITTKAQLCDESAAAITEQDTAGDFTVLYTAAATFFEIQNNNNGKTTDAQDSPVPARAIANGFVITIPDQGDGEDSALNHVLLSAAPTPGQQIDESARSLVNVINKNSNGSVYAFYLSGPTDLPGQILLEVKDIGVNQFSVTADSANTGENFNPSLPPVPNAQPVQGKAETKPNRIFFAKLQQPEAVPLLNFIDVGPEDKAISRILALRESLFILKEDGVYRLTGANGNYSVDLFDESTKIIAPDSAVVLNNQIYCLTNLGIVTISDTGVSIISQPIATNIQLLSSANYNYKNTSFGVSYENDSSYLLWMPSSVSDTVATVAYRHNTTTQTFTTFKMAKTCGLVNPGDDKLYLGPNDVNFIERERKLFNRTDFADRNFDLIIPSNSVNGTNLRLSSSVAITKGDAVVQNQYLTIGEYNQLLRKLDLDPSIGEAEITRFDFTAYAGLIPAALHGKYFTLYAASDVRRYAVFFDAQGDLPSLDTNVFTDLIGADQIRVNISSGILTKADLAEATKTAIQSATFDFVVSYTGGAQFFDTRTVRNGNTTDASAISGNPIGNGFAVTVLQQGLGDYYNSLQMMQGNNVYGKLNALATKLDTDPGIAQNDYLASIGTYAGTGNASVANPTVITAVGHNIQTGRLITITNSTTTPNINGQYVATRLSANTFSIPVAVTVAGSLNWAATLITFADAQGAFNTIVNKLNDDTGVSYQNYPLSSGVKEFEVLIISKALNTTDVMMQFSMPYMEGPITVYKGIACDVQYAPETFGDTSMLKQVTEATVIFEDSNFSRATVGFRTDLSPGFEVIDFTKSGKGDFGFFVFSQHNWGGGFSGVPLRTYIPRQKQRSRYIQLQFLHDSSRERFALYGHSYTFRPISERAYRS